MKHALIKTPRVLLAYVALLLTLSSPRFAAAQAVDAGVEPDAATEAAPEASPEDPEPGAGAGAADGGVDASTPTTDEAPDSAEQAAPAAPAPAAAPADGAAPTAPPAAPAAPADDTAPTAPAAAPSPSEVPPPAPDPATVAATAQPAPQDAAPEPIDVTVVGTPIARTAGSAHIVREKQLERFEYDDPHAVLNTVPGVYVRSEDGFGLRPNIGLRGVNPDRSKKVTLMEDGVLLGPAPYTAPAAYFFPLMTRMSQVRVIKGPGAISYGPQTVGGAIDFISRPIPTSPSGRADLALGMYGYSKIDAHFGTSDERTGFLVEGAHVGSSGFKELRDDADTGFYRNDWVVKGSYVLDPTSSLRNEVKLKLAYSDELSNETYLGLTDADFRENPLQRYQASALDRMRNHRFSIVATHVFEPIDNMSITTNAYRHDYERTWRKANHFRGVDLFSVLTGPDDARNQLFRGLLNGELDSSSPQETLLIGPNQREFVSQGVETRLRWDGATGVFTHRLESGMRIHNDLIDRRHSEDGFLLVSGELFLEGTATRVTAFNTAESLAFAAHIADAITYGPFTLTPGVRLELIGSSFEDRATQTRETHFAHAVLPGLGGFYAITDSFGLLAGVHRGFSPPPPGSDDDVEPELSVNLEGGARFTKGPARAEVIGFYNQYTNLTDVCTFASGCSGDAVDQQYDAGRARIYGFEAFADYAVPLSSAFKLPLTVAYTLTQTEFLDSFDSEDPIFGSVQARDEMPYVPQHQLGASIGLDHRLFGIDVGFSYVAAMREQAGDEDLNDVLATDAQFLVDISARARPFPRVELYANLRNAFDELYIVSRRPYGARPNAPRMLQVGTKIDL